MKRKRRKKRVIAPQAPVVEATEMEREWEDWLGARRVEKLFDRANVLVSITAYAVLPIVLLCDSPRAISSLAAYWNNQRFELLSPFLMNATFSVCGALLAYAALLTSAKLHPILDSGSISEALPLASRYTKIAALLLGVTVAFGLSLTPILRAPSIWLVEHVPILTRLGRFAVEKCLDYAIGGILFEMVSRWFNRKFRGMAQASPSTMETTAHPRTEPR